MPTLYLREYSSLANAGYLGGPSASAVQCPFEPALARQRVSILDENCVSAPFSASTKFIRLSTDTPCLVDIGAAPDAAVRGSLMLPGVEFFGVSDGHRLSVVEAP